MGFGCLGMERKGRSEARRQGLGTISLHRKSAAPLRAIESEGRHDDGGAGFGPRGKCCDIGILSGGICQEMEDGTIVPDVPRPGRLPCRYVGNDPGDISRKFAEPGFRVTERDIGNIQHGKI